MSDHSSAEMEVQFKPETGKAVVEGRTAVPFASFVKLVIQKKVQLISKTWGKEPVIVHSELLTQLASAPEDSRENMQNVILVTLIVGVLAGVAGFSLFQGVLLLLQVQLTIEHLFIVAGSIGVLALLLGLIIKLRKMPKGDKLTETMEGIASLMK